MEAVTITVSGRPFKVPKASLRKHSGYFEQRLNDSHNEHNLEFAGISADAFAILVNYFIKNELNLMDKSVQVLSAVVDAGSVLGVSALPQDLAKALKTLWSKMVDINTVMNLSSLLGMHSVMVRQIVEDVITVLLGDSENGGLRLSDLSYEIMIFVTRLGSFWDTLYGKCKYFYSYERFFEAVISWVVKNNTDETNIVALVNSLRLQTVSFKFLNDCVANAIGIADMKEQLKIAFHKEQEHIITKIDTHLRHLSVSCHDSKHGDVRLQVYNGEKFGWDEKLRFTRSPLDTRFCAASKSYVYALGDQTLTSVNMLGGSPVMVKYPERLEVSYCYAHSSSLYCFGWNRRNQVLYEFNSERRKFFNHGSLPVDSNFTATVFGNSLFVLGEILHAPVKANQLRVFRYDLKQYVFSWAAILKKTWSQPELTEQLVVEEKASNSKAYLVTEDDKMRVIVQESSCLKPHLYSYTFEMCTNNSCEIEPCRLDLPTLFDTHSVLAGLQNTPSGIVMLFKSSYKGEYSLALMDHWTSEIRTLGFLPHFPEAHSMSSEYVMMEVTENSTTPLPVIPLNANLLETEAGSEATLVTDENDLETANTKEYKSPRTHDLESSSKENDTTDGRLSRSGSRRSSLSSAHSISSRSSRRSQKKKTSIASKAISIMTSLTR